MSKSILQDITPSPWGVDQLNYIVVKEADTVAAMNLPEMVDALREISDPWGVRSSLLINDDASVIFEMAGIARKVLQKMQDQYDEGINN
jgi:hypothetical protein